MDAPHISSSLLNPLANSRKVGNHKDIPHQTKLEHVKARVSLDRPFTFSEALRLSRVYLRFSRSVFCSQLGRGTGESFNLMNIGTKSTRPISPTTPNMKFHDVAMINGRRRRGDSMLETGMEL